MATVVDWGILRVEVSRQEQAYDRTPVFKHVLRMLSLV